MIVGGGIVGVSTLCHLTKKGWSDVVLIEKMDPTHASTWHAAGLLPLFNMSFTVGQIQKLHEFVRGHSRRGCSWLDASGSPPPAACG